MQSQPRNTLTCLLARTILQTEVNLPRTDHKQLRIKNTQHEKAKKSDQEEISYFCFN